jgi:hypothetical protein
MISFWLYETGSAEVSGPPGPGTLWRRPPVSFIMDSTLPADPSQVFSADVGND